MSEMKYMSQQEAAVVLGIELADVERLITTGALPRYRLRGRYVRVRATDVAELASLPREWLLNA